MTKRRLFKRGFTLVELMIVVAIIGVLAALAIYGVRRYITSAKTAEARSAIGRMAKDASSAYNRETMSGSILGSGASTAVTNRLCAGATATVPAAKTGIQGMKYQSDPSEWNAGDISTGWRCLKFSLNEPQYFMYDYNATVASAAGDTFSAVAQGDLNGDTKVSTFQLDGELAAGTDGTLAVKVSPNIIETDPDE